MARSTTSGSGYVIVATNATLTFTNTGLNNGTLYYFVVSALNASGEGGNSSEVGARPTSFAPVTLGASYSPGTVQLNWPADHTGWQLQTQTNSLAVGLRTNWVNVPNATDTNHVNVMVDPAAEAVFFRLVRP